MGLYQQLKETFQKQYAERSPEYKERLQKWRRQPVVQQTEKPTNLTRARELGYKAKQGFVVARVRVKKGQRARKKPRGGRNPGSAGKYFSPGKSRQSIAEVKASARFPNLEVLNSYWVGQDGDRKYFEVILVDLHHPGVKLKLGKGRGRAQRGLTSSAKKGRGLRHKGRKK